MLDCRCRLECGFAHLSAAATEHFTAGIGVTGIAVTHVITLIVHIGIAYCCLIVFLRDVSIVIFVSRHVWDLLISISHFDSQQRLISTYSAAPATVKPVYAAGNG